MDPQVFRYAQLEKHIFNMSEDSLAKIPVANVYVDPWSRSSPINLSNRTPVNALASNALLSLASLRHRSLAH